MIQQDQPMTLRIESVIETEKEKKKKIIPDKKGCLKYAHQIT